MTEQVEDLIGWRRSDALRALVGARRLQQMVMSRQKVSGVMHLTATMQTSQATAKRSPRMHAATAMGILRKKLRTGRPWRRPWQNS